MLEYDMQPVSKNEFLFIYINQKFQNFFGSSLPSPLKFSMHLPQVPF
jgi:hypothetical protein